MKITLAMLREKNACAEGMAWVEENLPDGAEYREFIEKLEANYHDEWASWLIGNFEVLILTEKWRIDSLLEPLNKKPLNKKDAAKIGSSGYAAKIGSSGYAAKIGSSGDAAKIGSSGYAAKIGSSGYAAQIGSSGDAAQIGSSGDAAQIGSSGYAAKIGSSGYAAKIGSSGYAAKIGSSGYAAQIGSSGDAAQIEATGKNSIIVAAGLRTRAKAGENGCIALTWWDGKRRRVTVGYVGEGIDAGKWYGADEKTGKLVERRKGALKGVLTAIESRSIAAPNVASDCAKIEALFLIAEQLAEFNEKLEPARLVAAITEIQAKIDELDERAKP